MYVPEVYGTVSQNDPAPGGWVFNGRTIRSWTCDIMWVRCILLLVPMCLAGCSPMPSPGGPSPRAVLVVSSKAYSLQSILATLDSIGGALGSRIDKSKETISSERENFVDSRCTKLRIGIPIAGRTTTAWR